MNRDYRGSESENLQYLKFSKRTKSLSKTKNLQLLLHRYEERFFILSSETCGNLWLFLIIKSLKVLREKLLKRTL